MQKRVLMICRAYYPSNFTGSHRVAQLAKYLPDFGWEPVVACANWTPENSSGSYDTTLAAREDVCETHRVPYAGRPKTKIKSLLQRIWEIAEPYKSPYRFYRSMISSTDSLCQNQPFQAIWSTCFPGVSHAVANVMSRRYKLP